MSAHLKELGAIHERMRQKQRNSLRRVFQNLPEEGVRNLASMTDSDPNVEALVAKHGDGGEFCVIHTEAVRRLAWVPYKDNPSFGLLRILEHDPDSMRHPHAMTEPDFNTLIDE